MGHKTDKEQWEKPQFDIICTSEIKENVLAVQSGEGGDDVPDWLK